jgi:hypothetical protein
VKDYAKKPPVISTIDELAGQIMVKVLSRIE